MKKDNVVAEKSKEFAVRIINLYKYLCAEKNEYVLSKQLLRSGTSIGANIYEGNDSISRAEFTAKLYISLKEARESLYWLDLLVETEYITKAQHNSLYTDCEELVKLLTAIIKTLKSKV